MINILQILRNNARTFAWLDINSDFTMEKYRSCKYARRNSGRGMYVSASSSELGDRATWNTRSGTRSKSPCLWISMPEAKRTSTWPTFRVLLFDKLPSFTSYPSHFLQAKSHLSLSVPTNNEQTLWERSMCRPFAVWFIHNG